MPTKLTYRSLTPLLAGLFFTASAHAEFDLSLGLASKYLREGVSHSSSSMAVNGGLNWLHNSGLYVGGWASTINHKDDDLKLESDLYAGFYQPLSDKVALDVSFTRYRFHGDDNSFYQDYNELGTSLLFNDRTKLGWRGSNDYMGTGRSWQALDIAYVWPFNDFNIELYLANYHWLNKDVESGAAYNDRGKSHYWHFRLGLERTWKDWDYRIAFERGIVSGFYDGGSNFSFEVTKHFRLGR